MTTIKNVINFVLTILENTAYTIVWAVFHPISAVKWCVKAYFTMLFKTIIDLQVTRHEMRIMEEYDNKEQSKESVI